MAQDGTFIVGILTALIAARIIAKIIMARASALKSVP